MSERVPDHYALLGLPPTATQEQIKAAYRRRALRLHPDKNPSAEVEERFKRCTEAYNVLSDDQRRERYDTERLRDAGAAEILDMLRDMIGNRRRARAGRDLSCSVTLTLEEAAEGVSRRLSFTVEEPCGDCDASGAAPGGTIPCETCAGRGFRTSGLLSMPRLCARCGGQGVTITTPCEACSTVATVEVQREYLVRLPPGVRDGDLRLVKGQGEPGVFGGAPGDLQVLVSVEPHPLLRVEGRDVHLELPVTFAEACVGCSAEVPTLDGLVRMKVPAGTQSGRLFRLGGKGLRGERGQRGDQIVEVVVETPVSIKQAQREAITAAADACTETMMPRRAEFARRLQELKDERAEHARAS